MKGKRHATEEKIRILPDADGGKSIVELCREKNISEQTFHRWMRKFGMMEIPEARRLKELEGHDSAIANLFETIRQFIAPVGPAHNRKIGFIPVIAD
ncbi:MAG: hypothetical protein EXS39_07260 [Opitutaceae bacterium]|nr:hypothetical protein [Opitutaceae bacterium]